MKKVSTIFKTIFPLSILSLLLAVSSVIYAQVEVTTKSLDLESVNKHKNWKIIDAGVDASTQKVFVKFSSASCDIDKSTIGSMTTTTFNGLARKVDKLIFDNNFTYQTTEYNNTILYNTNNEVVLLGGKITKKAKESEVVFVTIKK